MLSAAEEQEVLSSALSVIRASCWFVMDTHAGAQATLQLLEFANAQLIEFRHYDQRVKNLPR